MSEDKLDFAQELQGFEKVLGESIRLSQQKANIASPTARHFYASVLFTTLITKAVSLAILLPHSTYSKKKFEHWDYSSTFVITRTLLETRIAFFYICVDACTEDEWDCRWNIFNVHDCLSRRQIFADIGAQTTDFETTAEELRSRLARNPSFLALPNGLKKRINDGKVAFLQPLEEIADRAGFDVADFRWFYRFSSGHVHSFPAAFYRMHPDMEDRGRGVHSSIEEGYTALAVSISKKLLEDSHRDFGKMFSGLEPLPNDTIGGSS